MDEAPKLGQYQTEGQDFLPSLEPPPFPKKLTL